DLPRAVRAGRSWRSSGFPASGSRASPPPARLPMRRAIPTGGGERRGRRPEGDGRPRRLSRGGAWPAILLLTPTGERVPGGRVSGALERLARFAVERRLPVIILYVSISALLAWSGTRIHLETSLAELLPTGTASADDFREYLAAGGTLD